LPSHEPLKPAAHTDRELISNLDMDDQRGYLMNGRRDRRRDGRRCYRRRDAGSGTVEHALLTAVIAAGVVGVVALGHSVAVRSVDVLDAKVPPTGIVAPTSTVAEP
jgi:hypothetical protein